MVDSKKVATFMSAPVTTDARKCADKYRIASLDIIYPIPSPARGIPMPFGVPIGFFLRKAKFPVAPLMSEPNGISA